MRTGVIGPRFVLIEAYESDPQREYPPIAASLAPLRAAAAAIRTDVSERSFLQSFAIAFRALIETRLSGGTVFNANISSAPFALALTMLPGMRFESFDDGFANVAPGQSLFLSDEPLEGGSIKRRTLRRFLPRGPAAASRDRIRRHFTIYPGLPNIVGEELLTPIRLRWRDHLSDADRTKLQRPIETLIIGSRYCEWPDSMNLRATVKEWASLNRADLYVVHPREDNPPVPEVAMCFDGPAEGIIDQLAQQRPLTVVHLDSSAALPFEKDDRVQLINLAPPSWTLDEVLAGLREDEAARSASRLAKESR